MKYALLTVGAMIAAAAAAPLTEEQYQFLFSKFSQQFNKGYEVQNVFQKYQTFKSNVDLIVAHNAQNKSFTMEINQFADMTLAEFEQFMGLKVVETEQDNSINAELAKMIRAPQAAAVDFEEIDWEKKGKVNAVKNQGQCGSCWAFSTTGVLEPIARINGRGNASLDLSEQFLVDCDTQSSGCNGGLMSLGLDTIKKYGGIAEQKDYPYTARDGSCKASKVDLNKDVVPAGYNTIKGVDAHMTALKKGPVAVAVAAGRSIQMYGKGVIPANCGGETGGVNHGVVITGTGVENGVKYFNVRNSWGANWGANGNFKVEYADTCKITSSGMNVQPYF